LNEVRYALAKASKVIVGYFAEYMIRQILGGVFLGADSYAGTNKFVAEVLHTTRDTVVTGVGTSLGQSHQSWLKRNVVITDNNITCRDLMEVEELS
jgi:hypothetical protein